MLFQRFLDRWVNGAKEAKVNAEKTQALFFKNDKVHEI
jgi:hypothetical protein